MKWEKNWKFMTYLEHYTIANIYKLFQLAWWRRKCLAQNGSTLTSGHLVVWVLRRIIATGFQTWLTKPRLASSLLGSRSHMHAALFNWAGAHHHALTLQGHTTMFSLLQGTPEPSWLRWAFLFLFCTQVLFLTVMMVLQGHCCHRQAVVKVSPDV
jgi:hypothetical protein